MNRYQNSKHARIRIERLIVADVGANTASHETTMLRDRAGDTMPERLLSRPLFTAFMAPAERVIDAPLYAKFLATLYALASMIRADILFLVLVALILANIWDTIVGRAAASKRGEPVDPNLARAGFLTKVSGIVMVLLVRVLEHWAETSQIVGLEHSRGALAAAATVTLLLMEFESIESHRITLGARPSPWLTPFLRFMRAVEARLLVAFNPPTPPPAPNEDP